MHGKPHYINGPYDDPPHVLAVLEHTVGLEGFHYTVSLDEIGDLDDGYHYSAAITNLDDDLSHAA